MIDIYVTLGILALIWLITVGFLLYSYARGSTTLRQLQVRVWTMVAVLGALAYAYVLVTR